MSRTDPRRAALDRAVAHFDGNKAALTRALDCASQNIFYWQRAGVPAHRAIQIEKVTGGAVPRWELRPDLFDPPPAAPERKRRIPRLLRARG